MKSAALLVVLICDVGGAGTPEQAQPVLDTFLRHLETTGGWKTNSLTGAYRNTAQSCNEYAKTHKPALVAADLGTFLAQRKAWGLKPLATMGGAKAKQYYLLVRKGSYKDLAALKGQKLVTPLPTNDKFLYRVVLGAKVGSDHFVPKHVRRPLKALRAVARGKAAAALVDETAYRYSKELDLPAELQALYVSRAMPGITLAATAHSAGHKELIKRVQTALPKLCKGAGVDMCKTFGVKTFAKAGRDPFVQLVQQYQRGR